MDRSAFRRADGAAQRAKGAARSVRDVLLDQPGVLPKEEQEDLARAVSFALGRTGQPPSRHTLDNPTPHDLAELNEQWRVYQEATNATARELTEKYGSIEQASTALGASVAARAEAHAGITAESVRTGMAARYNQLRREFEQKVEKERELGVRAREELLARTEAARAEVREADQALSRAGIGDSEAMNRYLSATVALDKAKAEVRADTSSVVYEFEQYSRELSTDRLVLSSGVDDQAKQEMRALADGYQQALGEVRDMGGGTYTWHERSKKEAKVAFNETAEVFPTEWVEHSENHRSGSPIAKVQKSRAHYSGGHVEKIRKRVHKKNIRETYNDYEERALQLEYQGDPARELRLVNIDEYNTKRWEVLHYETRSYLGEGYDPPRGRGWKKHAYIDYLGEEQDTWRRPKYEMETVEAVAVPEIKTSEGYAMVTGRSGTFATATHEMSHRFEATVPGISDLEQAFLQRRTTDPDTGQRTMFRIYPRRNEYAYSGGFVSNYMGKRYLNNDGSENRTYHELLSTGTEGLFGGNHGGLVGVGGDGTQHRSDHDMRAFVLGVLASAGREDAAAPPVRSSARQGEYGLASAPA